MGEGLATAPPKMFVAIDELSKVSIKPELSFKPGSQYGKEEGALGWNLEARV